MLYFLRSPLEVKFSYTKEGRGDLGISYDWRVLILVLFRCCRDSESVFRQKGVVEGKHLYQRETDPKKQ